MRFSTILQSIICRAPFFVQAVIYHSLSVTRHKPVTMFSYFVTCAKKASRTCLKHTRERGGEKEREKLELITLDALALRL